MVATQLAHTWPEHIATLLGITQCAAPNEYLRELVVAAENSQVLVYNGCGPWSHIEAQRYIQAKFGLRCYIAMQEKLEYVYNMYTASIMPPKCCIQADSTQVYFVQRPPISPLLASPMDTAAGSTISVTGLTELLLTRLRNNDHLANAAQHIVVVIRSPEDLFGETEEQLQESDGTTAPAGASNLTAAAGSLLLRKPLPNPSFPADSSAVPKLTGRHELLHGEFSSRPVGIPPQQDSSFLGLLSEETEDGAEERPSGSSEQYDSTLSMFLRVAAKWLQGGIHSTGDYELDWTTSENQNTRKLTLVSCNWDNGENFRISFNTKSTSETAVTHNHTDHVFIDHESLLQTKSYKDTGILSMIANKEKRSGNTAVSSFASAASLASAEGETGRAVGSRPASRTGLTTVASAADLAPSRPSSRDGTAHTSSNNSNSTSRSRLHPPHLLAAPPLSTPPDTVSAYEKSEAFTQSLTAAELILQRVTASLPKQAQLVFNDPTPLRAFQASTTATAVTMEKNIMEESTFIPVPDSQKESFWWRKEAELAANIPIESVAVASGPHIVRVSGSTVVVSVDTVGLGRVHCSIYEIPAFMQYSDVVSVVATEDRKKLRCLESKSQYSAGTGQRRMVFHFEQLMHFCCYCVVVDPFTDHIPAVALFRTLGLPSSAVDSILLCPTSPEDYRAPSQRVGRLMHFAAMSRSPISAAFCLDYNAAVLRNYIGEERKHKADLHYLRQQGNFKTPKENPDHNFQHTLPFLIHNSSYQSNKTTSTEHDSSVFVSTHGYYCYISTQNEEPSSLRKIIQAIRALQYNSTVRFVILLVNQPLIRYLRLRDDGQFVCDGPMMHHKLLCCMLFMTLLRWKAQDDGNDCKIICTAPVSEPKCILIRYAQHLTDTVHPQARYDDLSVATHYDSHSLKGSGMHLGGEFLEMPSLVLEPSVDAALLSSSQEGQFPRPELNNGGKFHNLGSIYESIADYGVNDLQLQHQLSAALTGSQLGSSHRVEPSVVLRDLIADKGGFLTLEHLILPVQHHSVEGEEVDESLTLPDGKCLIEDIIEYEVLQEYTAEETGVHRLAPRLELYRETLKADEKVQPVVYRLEFLVQLLQPREQILQRGEENMHNNSSSSDYSDLVSINTLHRVYLRPLLSEFDLVEMLLGPVIGRTTADTTIILFEFNMNLQQLSCVLQPLGAQDENDFVYKVIDNIKGFELIELQFAELLPGTYYEIFLPELFGTKVIGKFKTIQPYLSFAQIAFTSANTMKRHPINHTIVSQLIHQQTPNLLGIRLLNEIILEEEKTKQKQDESNRRVVRVGGYDNTWAKLGDHLNAPGVHTAAVFHLGGVAVLSEYWSSLVDAMIAQTRRLEIPLRDASTVGQWYFKQVEQIVKDSFRLFWNTPVVQEVFAHTSNIPLYQAQYLLPLSVLEDKLQALRIVESDTDNMLLQLVRRIFETHLHAYMARLYGWEAGASSHYIQWRSNSLVVVGIDSVSGRRKLKKKGDDEEEDETAAPAATPAKSGKLGKDTPKGTEKIDPKDPYSLGFIDRGQWKYIRSLVQDRTVTHIVILTERPIIPLTHLPVTFNVPETIAKSEILEWQPTQQDLEVFLKFWFDWLSMYQTGEVSACRSVLLVSSSKMPYSTLIQDMRTGQKIHQLCVGEYDSSTALRDLPFRPAGLY